MANAHKIVAAYSEDANLALALAKLADEGCEVRHVRTLYRALREIAMDPPDIVIVDADDLSPSDFAFFEEVRQAAPAARGLVVFSPAQRHKALKAVQNGADAYVLKPVCIEEVCAIVSRGLARPGDDDRDAAERLQSLTQLAQGVAHEISNPLTTISGWIQMLLADTPKNDPNHKTFKLMDEEARRIAKVVSGLLAFAEQPRPDRRRPADLARLVRRAIDRVRADHEANGLQIQPRLDETLPPAPVDDEQIQQAFQCLLEAAANASSDDSPIEVEAACNENKEIDIRVRRPGLVIENVDADNVFEPFYMSEGKSLGMGLAIAHRIIKSHGGRLTVASSPQTGSEFRVTLPLNGAGG